MIMNDSEVEERLNSPDNLCKVIEKSRGGKTEGSTNISPSMRALISITKNSSSDTCKEVGEEFGVDESSVSEISRGLVGGKLDKSLQKVGSSASTEREDSAHEAAMDVLMTSLSALQPKLVDPEMKAKDLSRIAADMSKVANNMKPREKEAGTVNNTQVILFAPPRKKLDKYDFMEA